MSDTPVKELQPAPDFTLPAIGDDEVVKQWPGSVKRTPWQKYCCYLFLSKR